MNCGTSKKTLYCIGLLGSTLLSGTAFAQSQDASAAAPAADVPNAVSPQAQDIAPPAGRAVQAGANEEIVVTGSRIARRDYESESPVVTVSTTNLTVGGKTTLGEALNQLPQFSASASSTSFGGQDLSTGGLSTVDLRGLGSRRTLVLLDGRRLQPSDLYNTIDLNSIPAALISSTEIITGGASAIYGSDALAGVVNLKTRRNFSGLVIDSQEGITTLGDGRTTDVSATFGANMDDNRANVVFSGSYYDRQGIFPSSSRSFFGESLPTTGFPGGGSISAGSNLPSQAAVKAVFDRYGTPTPPSTTFFLLNPGGTLFSQYFGYNYRGFPGLRIGDGPQQVFGYNNNFDYVTLSLPLKRYTAFARGTYEVTPNIELFAQFNYARFTTSSQGRGPSLFNQPPTVPASNPFVPPDLRQILNSRPNPNGPILYYALDPAAFGPDGSTVKSETYQFQVGASGKFPSLGWTWDTYFGSGRNDIDQTYDNRLSRPAYVALVSAPDGGASLCQGGLNLFPLLSVSDSCKAFLRRDPTNRQVLKQQVAEANLQGGLFNLPAGEVRFALGVAYRKNSFTFKPDAGLVRNPLTGYPDVLGLSSGAISAGAGSTNSKEVYGELLVPLLKDLPLLKRLELSLGYRYSDYDSVGGVSSYKAGLEWQTTSFLSFRGSYQKSIRAPSIGELYAPDSSSSAAIGSITSGGGDPCSRNSAFRTGPNAAQVKALCVAQFTASGLSAGLVDAYQTAAGAVPSLLRGNPDVTEERGKSFNVGTVIRPHFASSLLSRLSLSVDLFDIRIKNALGVIPGGAAIRACFNSNGENPTYSNTNFYCQLITRDNFSGNFFQLVTPTINLAQYHTRGIDAQLDWGFELTSLGLKGDPGNLALNAVVSYLDKYELSVQQNTPLTDYSDTIGNNAIGGLSHPRWKGVATLTYTNGPVTLGTRARYIGSMSNYLNVNTTATIPGVTAITYFDLFAYLNVAKSMTLRFGVSNVADKSPPAYTGFGATDPATYDVIGRSFYVGAKFSF